MSCILIKLHLSYFHQCVYHKCWLDTRSTFNWIKCINVANFDQLIILTLLFSAAAQISTPYLNYTLRRNPLYENAGNFMTLSDFLALAKNSSLVGVVISIEVSSCT